MQDVNGETDLRTIFYAAGEGRDWGECGWGFLRRGSCLLHICRISSLHRCVREQFASSFVTTCNAFYDDNPFMVIVGVAQMERELIR